MIVVIGEALVDLVAATDGTLVPALGGAPYNTARAVARLGGEVEFVGALSEDGFGQRLARQLIDDGVDVGRAPRTTRPTSLAVAEISPEGGAEYRFYLQGTSVPELTAETLRPVARDAEIVFTGGLALVVEPAASAIAELVDDLHDSTIVVVDLNCRPAAIDDQPRYLDVVARVLRRADLVKASDEDLAYLHPDVGPVGAARRLLADGPGAVVITAGADGTTIVTAGDTVVLPAATLPAALVDTIGAGDTFDGALLEWIAAAAIGRYDLTAERLVPAVSAGHAAAAVAVTRRGADPPWRSEL
jgi:fructokinase